MAPETYDDALNIYTDGSSYSNPRRGGIGILFVWINEAGDEVREEEANPGYEQGGSAEMELQACITALKAARGHRQIDAVERIVVFSDSIYVTDNVKRAIFVWPKQGWLNGDGRPIENATLWKGLVKAIKRLPKRVYFEWVKGHAKNPYNKAVDKLAKASAKGILEAPLRIATIRKKRTAYSGDASHLFRLMPTTDSG